MDLSEKIIRKLIIKGITLSVAESCTGGLLSSKITNISGVSKIFKMGLITYSNSAKFLILNIPISKINKYGAVSNQVAKLMVNNLQKKSKSNLCISTTGIAGPLGGTKIKPVGLVYIGIKYNNKTIVLKNLYKGTRKQIQRKTVKDIFKKIQTLI